MFIGLIAEGGRERGMNRPGVPRCACFLLAVIRFVVRHPAAVMTISDLAFSLAGRAGGDGERVTSAQELYELMRSSGPASVSLRQSVARASRVRRAQRSRA